MMIMTFVQLFILWHFHLMAFISISLILPTYLLTSATFSFYHFPLSNPQYFPLFIHIWFICSLCSLPLSALTSVICYRIELRSPN